MHHHNFLKAAGHQCSLSALYCGYGAKGLQRAHSQAKNIPASLYTPADYLVITLLRAEGNDCFTSWASFCQCAEPVLTPGCLTPAGSALLGLPPPGPWPRLWPESPIGIWSLLTSSGEGTAPGTTHQTFNMPTTCHSMQTAEHRQSGLAAVICWLKAADVQFFLKQWPGGAIATSELFVTTSTHRLKQPMEKEAAAPGCAVYCEAVGIPHQSRSGVLLCCCEIYAGMRGQHSVPSRSQRHIKGFIVWHLLVVAALSLLAGFKATLAFGVLSKSEQLPKGIFIFSAVISRKGNQCILIWRERA